MVEYAEVDYDACLWRTEMSILLRIDDRKVWVPMSRLEEPSEAPEPNVENPVAATISVAAWWAKQERLI